MMQPPRIFTMASHSMWRCGMLLSWMPITDERLMGHVHEYLQTTRFALLNGSDEIVKADAEVSAAMYTEHGNEDSREDFPVELDQCILRGTG